jgi:hypothetical protein
LVAAAYSGGVLQRQDEQNRVFWDEHIRDPPNMNNRKQAVQTALRLHPS